MEMLLTIWMTDQWTLWPLIPVTLATLSMETVPGLVRVMECGAGQIQRVMVGGFNSCRAILNVVFSCSY